MNPADTKLFADYIADRSVAKRNRIVERFMDLVDIHVWKFQRRLGTADVDDLRSAAYIGLIQAVERFDFGRGLQFSTFASPRIRGAILDACRHSDPLTRRGRDRMKAWQQASGVLRAELGRTPDDDEVERALGIAPGAWAIDITTAIVAEGSRYQYDHLLPEQHPFAFVCEDRHPGPSEVAESNDQFDQLLSTPTLTMRERKALRLRHGVGMLTEKMAPLMNCSGASVSQTLKSAREKIRAELAA